MFTPEINTLFYADTIKVHFVPIGSSSDSPVIHKHKDESYKKTIFRCLGVDDRVVVGMIVVGDCYAEKRRMLFRDDYIFFPVGPSVASALCIEH